MIKLFADKVILQALEVETVTSGSRKIYRCQFVFSPAWAGLTKTAVFLAGDVERAIILDDDHTCDIPHEVMENPGKNLFAGVRGTRDGEIVMPTTWTSIGWIQRGTDAAAFTAPPTPGVYDQLLAKYGEALARGLPPGGKKGQVPVKKSDSDYDVAWQSPSGGTGILPGGGAPGQILMKTEDGEDWQNLPAEKDPTVPQWAKQPEKPKYTAKEVGALPADTVIPPAYTLPQATADQLGGVKADPAEEGDTQPVRIGTDGKLVTDCYSKSYIDTALGNYITDIAAIVGGGA